MFIQAGRLIKPIRYMCTMPIKCLTQAYCTKHLNLSTLCALFFTMGMQAHPLILEYIEIGIIVIVQCCTAYLLFIVFIRMFGIFWLVFL